MSVTKSELVKMLNEVKTLQAAVKGMTAKKATNNAGFIMAGGGSKGNVAEGEFSFARAIKGLSTGDWDGAAKEKSIMGISGLGSGGAIVPDQYVDELIELLRPKTVLDKLPGVQFLYPDRGASLTIPRKGAGTTASWVGENVDIPLSTMTFEQIQMSAKKLAVLVGLSNSLLKFSSPSAENVLRQDMMAEAAEKTDIAMLRGSGTEHQPKGIRFSDGVDAWEIESPNGKVPDADDMIEAVARLENANAAPSAWVMSSRMKAVVRKMKTTDGDYIWRDALTQADPSTLLGLPVLICNQIPNNLTVGTSGDCTEIYLGEWNLLTVATWRTLELAASQDASLWDATDSRAVSAFQRDQTLVRLILETDIALRKPEGFLVMTGVRTVG